MKHLERHFIHRSGWLRAAVLGANDGIISTASLIAGVAASHAPRDAVLLSGAAGLVAGAMAMATGEYVSVSSQADSEKSDLAREARELESDFKGELRELASIYEARGLSADLAARVARELMEQDALAAHARDELGITEALAARPLQAALASAGTFAAGAMLPLLIVLLAPHSSLIWAVPAASLLALALLGALAGHTGGSPMLKSAARVSFWGALAMGLTAAVGSFLGVNL